MSDVDEARDRAEQAVYEAIQELAVKIDTDESLDVDAAKSKAEALDTLAIALRRASFGPQGGIYRYDNTTAYEYRSGHLDKRPEAGFAAGANGSALA